MSVSGMQWREAAAVLRQQALSFDRRAIEMDERERANVVICGVVSASGPTGEPLACGYPVGHPGAHAWSTLPTFSATPTEEQDA